MNFRAVDHSVNIIAFEKEKIKYSMCCAWTMMVDYDKLVCLLGSQSVTGNHIEKGDIIGISSLSFKQKDVAAKIGEGHSDAVNKLKDIPHTIKNGAIIIPNSKTEMICEVIDVVHLKEIEEDNLIYVRVLEHIENEGTFLHMEDF